MLDIETALDSPPQLEHHVLRLVDPCTLEADIYRGKSINSLFNELSERGIRVLSMRNKTNRLEELFMNLVETSAVSRGAA